MILLYVALIFMIVGVGSIFMFAGSIGYGVFNTAKTHTHVADAKQAQEFYRLHPEYGKKEKVVLNERVLVRFSDEVCPYLIRGAMRYSNKTSENYFLENGKCYRKRVYDDGEICWDRWDFKKDFWELNLKSGYPIEILKINEWKCLFL